MTPKSASARTAPSRSRRRGSASVGALRGLRGGAGGRRGVAAALAGRPAAPVFTGRPAAAFAGRADLVAGDALVERAVFWRGPGTAADGLPPSTTRNVARAGSAGASSVRRAGGGRSRVVRPRGVYACTSKIPPRPRTGPPPVAPPRAGARRGSAAGGPGVRAAVDRGAPRRVVFGSRRGSGARGDTATAPRPAR